MSRTILLADDSLTIQKVVELTFADTDYEVIAMSSGEDLLQRLPEALPDLVICDIIMPGKDGYEVCQEIKSNPQTLHIPVILLSGTFEPFDRDHALAAGCSEIITKPFEARKLVETVERLLEGVGGDEPAPHVEPPPRRTPVAPVAPPAAPTFREPESEATVAHAAGDEGLDFTDGGFAEMEAAGEAPFGDDDAAPDDGLDFEFSDEAEAFGAAVEPVSLAEPIAEIGDEMPGAPIDDDQYAEAEFPMDPEMPAGREIYDEQPEPPPPGDDTSPSMARAFEPFGVTQEVRPVAPPPGGPSEQPFAVGDEPLTTEPGARPLPTAPDIEEPMDEASVDVPEVGEEQLVAAEDASAGAFDFASDESDTDLFEAPRPGGIATLPEPPAAGIAEPAPSPAGVNGTTLSDADVDRIARRILELASGTIEQVAWEVIPDMAEIVVRQRIRELEAEAETPRDDRSR